MGFFSPWFLSGVVAVGLPIWLHLLKRHKTDPHLFPSLMFFEHREQSSVQHRRLDYILLFILRTLMLILLALLFADPGELRGAVSAIKESDARASFGELARYLRTLSESTKTPLEVHLISDLQKSGMPPGFTDLRLDQDTEINFHPVGKVQPNWAVE